METVKFVIEIPKDKVAEIAKAMCKDNLAKILNMDDETWLKEKFQEEILRRWSVYSTKLYKERKIESMPVQPEVTVTKENMK